MLDRKARFKACGLHQADSGGGNADSLDTAKIQRQYPVFGAKAAGNDDSNGRGGPRERNPFLEEEAEMSDDDGHSSDGSDSDVDDDGELVRPCLALG